MRQFKRVHSSFTANNRPFGMGRVSGSKWAAHHSLARDSSAKTSFYALLSPPITLACGPTTISRSMGILIAGRQEGTTPKTY